MARAGSAAAVALLPALVALAAVACGSGRVATAAAADAGPAGGAAVGSAFERRRSAGARLAAAMALALASGYGVAALHRAFDPLPDLLEAWRARGFVDGETPLRLRVRVRLASVLPDDRVALRVRLLRYELPGDRRLEGSIRRGVDLRLVVAHAGPGEAAAWRPGDVLDLTARLALPRSFLNPGGFDYVAWLEARGIRLTGGVKSPRLVVPARVAGRPFDRIAPAARQFVVDTLQRAAGDTTTGPFLAALLVGERDELPPALEDALLKAGVYHIVALSGLNVALVALLFGAGLRLVPAGPGVRRAAVASLVVIYWAVAQGSGSIHRATLMALLHLGGAASRRRTTAAGTVAVTAVLVVAWNPAWIEDAGFQLTFLATLGLVLSGAGRSPAIASRGGAPWRWLKASLRVSAAATAATALVSARQFHTMTPAALAGNLVAVPLASLLLVLALGIVVTAPWSGAVAAVLAVAARCALAVLERVAGLLAAVPGLSFHVLPPPGTLVSWGVAAVLAAGLARGAPAVAARLVLLAALAWTAAAGRGTPARGPLSLTVLDVGQGDAIFVRLPDGATLLVDAGGFTRGEFDTGARVVAPAIRALGTLRLDVLAITHAHRDHLGGAASIVEQMRPRAVWLGRMPEDDEETARLERLSEARGASIVRPRRGVSIPLGDARVEVLNPGGPAASRSATNEDSLVLRIVGAGQAALLTGDMEERLESTLLRERRALRAGVLKVGHHGSRTSTSEPFLEAVDPRMAAISVGTRNRFQHPDPEVMARLVAAGALVFRTDRDGAVRLTAEDGAPWRAEILATRRSRGP